MHRPNVTMQITEKQKKSLRKIAKQHGLLIGRGRYAKLGSIRALNQGVADGELVVITAEQWEGCNEQTE